MSDTIISARRLFRALAAAIIFATGIQASAVQNYRVVDLGSGAGDLSHAYSINNAGDVVGFTSAFGGQRACVWRAGGANGVADLGVTNATYNLSCAYSINNQGTIVGEFDTHAFCLGPQAASFDAGQAHAAAFAVNDNGLAVGSTGGGAWVWDTLANRNYNLPYLSNPGSNDVAWGVNDSGLMIGESNLTACMWQNGLIERIPGMSGALGLNNRGNIVGYSLSEAGIAHACMSNGSEIIDFGALVSGASSSANDINELNQVVGSSYASDSFSHAFVWDAVSGMQALPVLPGYDQSMAYAINDNGWIVGWAQESGRDHAMLWQPVPEPSSFLLVLVGLGGVLLRRKR